ncbi:hypothetical protein Pmar_PMAR011170 [Perkinsus marinus ATCC 50983]|uniref:Uncharacterized protein n=1 Tax=Perkinsus marinus (strain ATCC 50983 / TXsc) TaxID=423536 RepID=C5L1N9_PERM5|nr:hypothetical protein Pmar_PMAR011170 [Perkinsus marinus ATCC 50983]EER09351.1 hypothetical protein Pmar_PMAR011170 [Perkinsus marinus ATCC 50983]|eukprot:XP_002777535.1 hypothetical protein Pmar_PMAR011170 [Perkinsus marinus ATCC 50983]
MVNPAEYWKFESFAQKQDEIGTFALYYVSFLMIFVLSMVWWLPVAGRDDDDDDPAKLAELPVYHSIEKEYGRLLGSARNKVYLAKNAITVLFDGPGGIVAGSKVPVIEATA